MKIKSFYSFLLDALPKFLSFYLLSSFHTMLVKYFTAGSNEDESLPIDVSFMREIWSPDAEIRNLKEFRTLNVLSKVRNQYLKFKTKDKIEISLKFKFNIYL